jgi:hypothetical protein
MTTQRPQHSSASYSRISREAMWQGCAIQGGQGRGFGFGRCTSFKGFEGKTLDRTISMLSSLNLEATPT